MKIVKLNIHLEHELHSFITEQWTSPKLTVLHEVSLMIVLRRFSGTRLLQASPPFESYKSQF